MLLRRLVQNTKKVAFTPAGSRKISQQKFFELAQGQNQEIDEKQVNAFYEKIRDSGKNPNANVTMQAAVFDSKLYFGRSSGSGGVLDTKTGKYKILHRKNMQKKIESAANRGSVPAQKTLELAERWQKDKNTNHPFACVEKRLDATFFTFEQPATKNIPRVQEKFNKGKTAAYTPSDQRVATCKSCLQNGYPQTDKGMTIEKEIAKFKKK